MYEKKFIADAVRHSTSSEVDRRKLFTMLGVAGAGAAVATVGGGALSASATEAASTVDDAAVLNFALNLEYLEAEFYLRAVYGHGLSIADSESNDHAAGAVRTYGNTKVPFKTKAIEKYAKEIADDELQHVRFLRKNLGGAAVSRPEISLAYAFTAAATAAGVIKAGQKFNVFANETNFLLGAFLFEDVGVTAYKGAAGLLASKTFLNAAAGILAVEAYHAGAVRSVLYGLAERTPALFTTVQKLSDARDTLDGTKWQFDQGIGNSKSANITPVDRSGIAYGRTTGQVLDIVYLNLTKQPVKKGGFYPRGVNGIVNESAGSLGK